MWTRIGTAAVALPLFLAVLWLGGYGFLALSALLAAVGFWEYGRMWSHGGQPVLLFVGVALAALMVVAAGLLGPAGLVAALVLAVLVTLTMQVLQFGRVEAGAVALTQAGLLYVGALFAHFPLLRELIGGFRLILFAFLVTWVTDTAAYFVGRALGRRKLAPRLSPGKTVEGAVGGLGAAALLGGLLGPSLLAPALAAVPMGPLAAGFSAGLSVLTALAALVGDLAESALKRQVGIKDSGALLPGHGGVLDRFDSALFTVPVVYYALRLLGA